MKTSHQLLLRSCQCQWAVVIWSTLLVAALPQPLADHRYMRNTKFNGLSAGVHRSSKLRTDVDNDVHVEAFSSASVTTATTHQESPPQALTFQVPAEAFLTGAPAGVSATLVSSSESILGATASGVVTRPTSVFVRPIGVLPIPTEHFGIDTPRPVGPNSIPNCGCVSRGACLGEVGAYTRLVLPFTDVVCGHTFQTCCFDGAWPGSYDSFAVAASCVPKEECSRPYGVLPTDIRDFGVIAPCPGQGAVRCITVDSVGLLEFQAAVAAIDAANVYHTHHVHSNPIHFVIPFAGGRHGESTTVEATATSLVSSSHADDVEEYACESVECIPIAEISNVIAEIPVVPVQPQIILQPPSLVQPNIIVQAAAAPAQPNIIVQSAAPPPNIFLQPAAPAQAQIIFNVPAPIRPEILVAETPVPLPPVNILPVVVPHKVLTPMGRPHLFPTPIAGPLSPLFGYGGAGFGFRKRISFTKGFGFGGYGK